MKPGDLENLLTQIPSQAHRFQHEKAVETAVVLPLLAHLDWQTHSLDEVYPAPEPCVSYALRINGGVRVCIVIQKKVDALAGPFKSYADRNNVEILILTDGLSWRFFVLSPDGTRYDLAHEINIESCDSDEEFATVARDFRRFLLKLNVADGSAVQALQQMVKPLPPWHKLGVLWEKLCSEPDVHSFDKFAAEISSLTERGCSATAVRKLFPTNIYPPIIYIDPDSNISLAFTRIHEARFGTILENKWNSLARVGIRQAIENGISVRELQYEMGISLCKGNRIDRGYHPLRLRNGEYISVQGVDANNAWKNALYLARRLKTEISVRFSFPDKPEVPHPGRTAIMEWSP